jgi:hypothetical protein
MDSNVYLALAIFAAGVLIVLYIRRHGANNTASVVAAVQSAAASVKTHVAETVATAQSKIGNITVAAVNRVAAAPQPSATDRQIDPTLSASGAAASTADTATALPPASTGAANGAGSILTKPAEVEKAPAPAPIGAQANAAAEEVPTAAAKSAAPQQSIAKGSDMDALEPLTGQNLVDMLYLRAAGSSGPNVPQYQRLTAALGASYRNYANAYGGGGQFFVPAQHTGQFISDWSHGWTIVGIGGMTPEQFASVKPDLAAAGFSVT